MTDKLFLEGFEPLDETREALQERVKAHVEHNTGFVARVRQGHCTLRLRFRCAGPTSGSHRACPAGSSSLLRVLFVAPATGICHALFSVVPAGQTAAGKLLIAVCTLVSMMSACVFLRLRISEPRLLSTHFWTSSGVLLGFWVHSHAPLLWTYGEDTADLPWLTPMHDANVDLHVVDRGAKNTSARWHSMWGCPTTSTPPRRPSASSLPSLSLTW